MRCNFLAGGAILRQEVASRFARKLFFFKIRNLNNSFENEENDLSFLLVRNLRLVPENACSFVVS